MACDVAMGKQAGTVSISPRALPRWRQKGRGATWLALRIELGERAGSRLKAWRGGETRKGRDGRQSKSSRGMGE